MKVAYLLATCLLQTHICAINTCWPYKPPTADTPTHLLSKLISEYVTAKNDETDQTHKIIDLEQRIDSAIRCAMTAKKQLGSMPFTLSTNARQSYSNLKLIKYLRGETKPALVKNNNGNLFVIKQGKIGKITPLRCCFTPMIEMLGTIISRSIKTPVNKVTLIPDYVTLAGKPSNFCAATLHFYIPSIPGSHKGFRKKQIAWNRSFDENMTIMSKYTGLASIFAVDTFLCNEDRHFGNILFDLWTDTIFAVDMGRCFHKNSLTQTVCKYMENHDLEILSGETWMSMKIFTNTIKKLLDLWPPQSTQDLLISIATAAGFGWEIAPNERTQINQLRKYMALIEESYRDAKKLLLIGEKILHKECYQAHTIQICPDFKHWMAHAEARFYRAWARIPTNGLNTVANATLFKNW